MSQEEESLPKTSKETLRGISAGLGFIETDSMQYIRRELESGDLLEEKFRENLTRYQDLANEQIQNAEDQTKAEIGFSISKAAIYLAAGRTEDMKAEIEMARDYAFNMYFDDIVKDLDSVR